MRRIEEGAREVPAPSEGHGGDQRREVHDQQDNEETRTEAMEAADDQMPQRQADVSTPEMDEEVPPANPMPSPPTPEAVRQITNWLRDDPRRYLDAPVGGPLEAGQPDDPRAARQQGEEEPENVWAGLN